ncbi:MAG: 5'-methylthioadenosine/S-adenosylhomocysteine nucleosidase [bacterium]|nr:5'-methylthioadenosine/S-adenosylhomocysteine nucleosidase [bacterium]
MVRRLRQRELVTTVGLKLTRAGRSFIEEQRTLYPDVKTYNLDSRWKQAAETFSESLVRERPPSYRSQELWLLQGLLEQRDGDPPLSDHPDRKMKCPRWTEVVRRLRQRELVTTVGLKLTRAGRSFIEEQRTLYPDGLPEDEPFRLHVGPIATASQVVEDGRVFERLARAARKVLGLEMEAAAIGMVAEVERVRWMIVAKGVVDHADGEKDDSFRSFAARASAEFVLAFLRRELPSR